MGLLAGSNQRERSTEGRVCHSRWPQFKVMAMGLCSAPGSFQRMMDVVMSGLKWTTSLVYLDDIVVYSRTF
jgi:hypothetical protein